MTQAETLREAGWRVVEKDTVFEILSPEANETHGWIQVTRNADGSMHLVTARSGDHRRIASTLGLATTKMPGNMT